VRGEAGDADADEAQRARPVAQGAVEERARELADAGAVVGAGRERRRAGADREVRVAQLRRDGAPGLPALAEVPANFVEVPAKRIPYFKPSKELKDLVTFYKSPLGQKLLVSEPRAIQFSMSYMNQWATIFAETVNSQFRTEMKKRGKDI